MLKNTYFDIGGKGTTNFWGLQRKKLKDMISEEICLKTVFFSVLKNAKRIQIMA